MTRPTIYITENWRAGQKRFGWRCSGCLAERVGFTVREPAHQSGRDHRCPEEVIPPESPDREESA